MVEQIFKSITLTCYFLKLLKTLECRSGFTIFEETFVLIYADLDKFNIKKQQ